jgi:hypothetical protein
VFKARRSFTPRQSVQAIRAVNAVRAPEDHGDATKASVLEDMNRSEAIVRDIKKWIPITANDRGLGPHIPDQINTGGKITEVFGIARITMEEGDPMARQNWNISFATSTNQVVHH